MQERSSIPYSETTRYMTSKFYGMNTGLKIQNGEWNFSKNLSTRFFPLMANRPKRGRVQQLAAPGGLIEKDALAYVDGGTLFYNGTATGLTGLESGEKQMVSMGAYICIFPDKAYFNTADFSDFGRMEASYESQGEIRYELCRFDGTVYDNAYTGDEEPESSVEIWIDTSGGSSIAMQWSESSGGWVEVPTVYTKITFTTMDALGAFNVNDGVEISGADFEDANGSKVLWGVGGSETEQDYIVIVGILDNPFTQTEGSISIERKLPLLDFVCECQNRLWGCYYGNDGEKNINEIYCSALGDFKNWRQYAGLSTDSWTASVGSDGQWTGAVNYLGYPTFFKENRIHRVSVSSVGAHQIDEVVSRGVQKGSHKSLVVVNETLYYKSRSDVCAWQGGFPDTISSALGQERYSNAVAGAFGNRYYISMQDALYNWHLFVYDIEQGLWLREDELHAMSFAAVDDELYCIDADTDVLLAMNGTTGELPSKVLWEAESGMQYYEYPDKKYVSRYNFRISLEEGCKMEIYIQYDSDGVWCYSGKVVAKRTGTVTVPIRPRRCDHMKIKLVGEGEVRLYSIARILEEGSDK